MSASICSYQHGGREQNLALALIVSTPARWYRDDDRYWLGGVLYNNPDDPDPFVHKRYGFGWTINFGHPVGKLFMLFMLLLVLLPVILALLGVHLTPMGCHPSGCYPGHKKSTEQVIRRHVIPLKVGGPAVKSGVSRRDSCGC